MAEAHDTQGALAAERDAEFFPINKLPKELLVSVFVALDDQTWVRHTIPRVCKEWNEIYCSRDASPLHETLEVNFRKEVDEAAGEGELDYDMEDDSGDEPDSESESESGSESEDDEDEDDEEERAPRGPVVHASRVIAWAARRAGDVRKLHLKRGFHGALRDFTARDLGTLVAVVGSSVTDISISSYVHRRFKRPFWESLRRSVVPAGRLRSFVVRGSRSDVNESDLEPLGQLAGSLEVLVLNDWSRTSPLSRLPESFFALKELRRLDLFGHRRITAIPAEISSLKKLENLFLGHCDLSSLPKELSELSGLTALTLSGNENLGNTPQDEAFPAELATMKSLRYLSLGNCGLSTVPSFVLELKSLESLNLGSCRLSSLPKELSELSGLKTLNIGGNEFGNTPQDEAFSAELGKMTSLRYLSCRGCGFRTVPAFVAELKSLRNLELYDCGLRTVPAFVGKLKSLKSLDLHENKLSSLPKELGELSGLTRLDLTSNEDLGTTLPADEAFPAELGGIKSLRELKLWDCRLSAVPAFVGELKSLEDLYLIGNDLSSLPKELGDLSGLTRLDLRGNHHLGNSPEDAAFPRELGKLKSLKYLILCDCGLSTVPAFVGELESLEVLDISDNDDLQIDAPLDFLVEGCPLLRFVRLVKGDPWTERSLAHIEAFEAKLLARNAKAKVFFEW